MQELIKKAGADKVQKKKNKEVMAEINHQLNNLKTKQEEMVDGRLDKVLQQQIQRVDQEIQYATSQCQNMSECVNEMDGNASDDEEKAQFETLKG